LNIVEIAAYKVKALLALFSATSSALDRVSYMFVQNLRRPKQKQFFDLFFCRSDDHMAFMLWPQLADVGRCTSHDDRG